MENVSTSLPFYFWLSNALTVALGIFGSWYLWMRCKETKSEQLIGYIPTFWTSLGILFTFISIFWGLWDYIHTGKELDIHDIIANVIPAFSTSIIGISGAIISTFINKVSIAKSEDSENRGFMRLKEQVLGKASKSDSPELIVLEILRSTKENHVSTSNMLRETSNRIAATISDALDSQRSDFSTLFDKLTTTFTQTIYLTTKTLSDESKQRNDQLQKFLTDISDVFDNISGRFEKRIADHLEAEKKLFQEDIKNTIEEFGRIQHEKCAAAIEDCIARMNDNARQCLSNQVDVNNDFIESLKSNIGKLCNDLNEKGEKLIEDINRKLQEIHDQEVKALNSAIGHNISNVTELSETIKDNYDLICEKIADSLQFKELENSAKSLTGEIKSSMTGVKNKMDAIVTQLDTTAGTVKLSADKYNEAVNNIDALNNYIDSSTGLFKLHNLSLDELKLLVSSMTEAIRNVDTRLSEILGGDRQDVAN